MQPTWMNLRIIRLSERGEAPEIKNTGSFHLSDILGKVNYRDRDQISEGI